MLTLASVCYISTSKPTVPNMSVSGSEMLTLATVCYISASKPTVPNMSVYVSEMLTLVCYISTRELHFEYKRHADTSLSMLHFDKYTHGPKHVRF